jgi:hypothetical protein
LRRSTEVGRLTRPIHRPILKINPREQCRLVQKRQQPGVRRRGREEFSPLGVSTIGRREGEFHSVHGHVGLRCQPQLPEMIEALRSSRRLTCGLNGRENQRREEAQHPQCDEDLNERHAATQTPTRWQALVVHWSNRSLSTGSR